jgi:UDP-N-acetylglucosamine 2-epimerase
MKIMTVVGARPQFVKASAVSAAITGAAHLDEIIVHTGQHYDEAMSGSFFTELGIAPPRHNLEVGSGGHGEQTGVMMQRLERVVAEEQPDCMLVYGDTNSTLAAALVGAKLLLPIAHVEAGLRSFDRSMPEEINRVVTDHVSSHLYCPSEVAIANLRNEGVVEGVHLVGDVMHDVIRREMAKLGAENPVAARSGVAPGYVLVTIHRPGNTDDSRRLGEILDAVEALAASGMPVIWPVHPRARPLLAEWSAPAGVHLVEPASYRETVALLRDARSVLTDSGGLQKEAYWMATPCVTVRPSTEWVETVDEGWNRLVDADRTEIVAATLSAAPGDSTRQAYGTGDAAARIVDLIAVMTDDAA